MFDRFVLEDRRQIIKNLMRRRLVLLDDLTDQIHGALEVYDDVEDRPKNLYNSIDQWLHLFREDLFKIDRVILDVLSAKDIGQAFESVDTFTLGQ